MQTEFAIAVSVVLPLWFCCIFCSHVLQNVPCQTCSSYCEWRVSPCFPSTRQSFPCDKLQRWNLYLPAPSWRIAWKRVCYKMPVRRLEGSQCFRLHERLQKVSWIRKQRENMIGKNWMRSYANEDGEKNARCVPRQLGSIEGLSISPSAEDYSIHLSWSSTLFSQAWAKPSQKNHRKDSGVYLLEQRDGFKSCVHYLKHLHQNRRINTWSPFAAF